MNASERNLQRLQPLLDHLSHAVASGDAAQFERVLDDLLHARRKDLFSELRRLTGQVRGALEDFQLGARCAELAEKDVPDARQRLVHVLKLTDEAAHRTMDLIESCGTKLDVVVAGLDARPVAATDQALSAPQAAAHAAANELRSKLSDMLLAQGYQDLTGQILRSVITLVDEVEKALSGLARIVEELPGEAPRPISSPGGAYGPAVPGIDHGATVENQQDVDALLSSLAL